MHMARRARHGEATKAWRRSSLKVELSRNARVDDTCWRRPGDAMAWRSAASITNLLGSSLEGYHLLTPLMPIEEENTCLAKCWPGSGGEDRAGGHHAGHHAGPIGDEELAKGKPRQAPLQGASSFFGGGSNSLAIDWSLTANLPWPTLDDVAWEAAADAKLRAVGDACCTFSFPDFSNVSHAFPSLAALWEAEGLL